MESVIKISSGASKWDIRDKVWDYIEDNNLANFPRPVHNRIPNFKGAAQACDRLAILQEFKSAQTVKINPDRPQQQARFITLDGAHTACTRLSQLQAFTKTAEVKVDPDKPLEGARLAVLEARKTLLVPTPRLRSGLFNKITPPQGATKQDLRVCASSQGVKEFSVPVGLDAKVKVDLLVVGSVAVSEKGYRIGKGEGFADMEYGMMVSMGAVDQSTVVVTVVHDCQVVDIEEELIENHDLTVDYILTPTRMIKTDCQRPKPPGIIWSKLNTDMLQKIPILKKLRDLEQQAGKDVTLGTAPSEGTSPTQRKEARPQARRRPRRDMPQDAEGEPRWARRQENTEVSEQRPRQARVRKDGRDGKDSRGEGRGNRGGEGREGVKGEGREVGKGKSRDGDRERRERTGEEGGGEAVTTVYLGGLPAGLRVSELKVALREREAVPLRLAWQGAQHRAFLDYCDLQAAETALMALQGLSLNGHSLQAEMAKRQRGGRWSGQANRRPKPAAAPRSKIRPPESSSETQAKDQQPSKA